MGPPLFFSHSACLGHETGEHPESPSRIQAIEAELERRGWLGYERREAPAAPLDAIMAVHTEAYSIHQARIFPGTGPLRDTGARAGEGFSINLPVPAGSGEDAWISLLEHIAVPAALEFRPDLVLISAGFEAHRDDAYGDCDLDAGSFAEMTRHLRALGEEVEAPVGVVLEGGYALQPLAASVAATMEALASDEPPELAAPGFLTGRAASYIGHHWTL